MCVGATYDPKTSGTATSSQPSQRNYGAAKLVGYTYADTVCLSKDISSCILNFEYFSIQNQTGLNPPIQGVFGLSQNRQFMMIPDK
jgi:hypothetical protein